MSPYLRAFVVARINPLRWIKDEPPPLDEVLKTMRERAAQVQCRQGKTAGRGEERRRAGERIATHAQASVGI